jgi:hypothetical protein
MEEHFQPKQINGHQLKYMEREEQKTVFRILHKRSGTE